MPRLNKIQYRRGTAEEWATADPVLLEGEPGYDLTNNRFKIGDGTNPYSSLISPFVRSTVSASEPTNAETGDIWYNSVTSTTYTYNGAAFISTVRYLVQRHIPHVVTDNVALMPWPVPAPCTITFSKMALESAPSATGSYCKVQVMRNGMLETNSIFSSDVPMQITELTTATNGMYLAQGTLDPANISLSAGDVLYFRVNQADTGSVGLVVQIMVTFT